MLHRVKPIALLALIFLAAQSFNLVPVEAKPAAASVRVRVDQPNTATLVPRRVPPRPAHTTVAGGSDGGYVVVKLREGLAVRQVDTRLVDERLGDLAAVNRVLARRDVADLRPLFSRSREDLRAERLAAQAKTRVQLPDLRLYYRLEVADAGAAGEIIDLLNRQEDVEIAYYQPAPELAQAPADPSVTPNFETSQTYLQAAPGGVDAYYAWTRSGGKGQGIKIVDIEGAWRTTHEDLTRSVGGLLGGTMINDLSWRNHGTAVLGEMIADSNTYGVTGIAHGADIGMVSIGSLSAEEAISLATAALEPGDAILIELHAAGPRYDFQSREDQLGYVCMEYWQANFDAIQIASAKGVIVCEAAGNGAENLDDAIYQQRFDTTYRNSHAIMCGAGAPPSGAYGPDRSRLSFSNFGQRVNLQGYGRGVVTTGYGGLYSTGGENFYYTSTFSGTSSASPIVTGAVACLSGYYMAAYGAPLTPDIALSTLASTGSVQFPDGSEHIGPRPNLSTAINSIPTPSPIRVEPVFWDTALTQGDQVTLVLTLTNGLPATPVDFQVTAYDSMLFRAPDAPWLSVSPTSGQVPGDGGSVPLTATVDATTLDPDSGMVKGTVKIVATVGPSSSELLVPVFITPLCAADTTYEVTDSDVSGGPAFNWVDAKALGQVIPQGSFYNTPIPSSALDDGTAGPILIGFGFDFYGTVHNQVYIGVNGAISFTSTELNDNGYFSGLSIPGAFINDGIFALWNDLVIGPSPGHGNIYTYRSATSDTFVVEWYRVGNFNSLSDTLTTFEIVLTADGVIRLQYLNVGTTGLDQTATAGLQQAGCRCEPYVDGAVPPANVPHASLAVEFRRPSCDCAGYGDCDGNMVINPIDVVLMVNFVYKSVGNPPPAVPQCPGNNGDWNCDGAINPVDIVLLVNNVYRTGSGPCDPCLCNLYPVDCP